MLRGYCQVTLYCRFCDSVSTSSFFVRFLDSPAELCRVGDDVGDELVGLWRRYAVVRFPDREVDAQILELAECSSCSSRLWVRLAFANGVLEQASAVPLTARTLAEVNYVSMEVHHRFALITGEPLEIDNRIRSEWPGILAAHRACDGVWTKGRWLRVQPSTDGFTIDDDLTGTWTAITRACRESGTLHKLGFADEVLEVAGVHVGPTSVLHVPDDIRQLRAGTDAPDLWAIRRPSDEWTFSSGRQVRALAASVAVLGDVAWATTAHDPMLYRTLDRGLRIVEDVAGTRYRAIARDGRTALVDLEPSGGQPTITDEPGGSPLGSISAPLWTESCAAIGSELAAWATQRPEGRRVLFELADVYVMLEPQLVTVTGVVPSGGRNYAPREVLQRGPLMAAGDVFTICAIVAHLATGEHPFDGGEQGIVEERRRAFWGSRAIARIVDRGLDRDPDRRGTLEQLRDDFEQIRRGQW